MNAKDVLQKAYELLSDPARWTQEAYARDIDGKPLREWEPQAVCWCLDGALKQYPNGRLNETRAIVSKAIGTQFEIRGQDIHQFNDTHTHDEILEAIRVAITSAE